MKNVKATVKGDILTLEIDLTQDFGKSGSGKTNIVASTEGAARVEGHDSIQYGLNVYKR